MQTTPSTAAVREPESRPRRSGPSLLWALVVLAAALAAALAPAPWTAGAGELQVSRSGQTVAIPVQVGATEAVVADGVSAPDGLGLDQPVRVLVEVSTSGTPEPVDVHLVLPDGRREAVPVVAVEAGTAVAVRRPVQGAAPVLALLAVVVVLWVSELLPLWVTSLLVPVALSLGGVLEATEALAPFFHPVIALFFAGFLLAEAMRAVGLDETIATRIVEVAGARPVTLFAGFLALAAGMSIFMSNTAAVAVLLPVALAVTAPLEDPAYRRTLVLGTAYAATIGGVGSAIGTPAGPLAITFLEDVAGREVTFVGWFAFGVPMLVLFLPLLGWYLWRRLAPEVDAAAFAAVTARARAVARDEALDRPKVTVLVVFVAIVAGWVTEPLHGVHIGIVALLGVVALAVLGRVGTADLSRISWASLLTFGGGLTLGIGLTTAGVSDWIATRLAVVASLPTSVAVGVVAATALGLTTVASNTAAAAMFIPLAIPLAAVIGVDPVLLVVVVAIASSIDFALVIGTPPTMLAYSTGLFTAREVLRIGSVLDLVGLLVLVVAVTQVWSWLGVVP